MPTFDWINDKALTQMAKKCETKTERLCFDIVKRMILKHGIDVVYPCLETLDFWLDKELAKGEGDR